MKKKYFVGIDVSNQTIDVAFIIHGGEQKHSLVGKYLTTMSTDFGK
jgi:hypothetical protein